jgi:hypothetical protein
MVAYEPFKFSQPALEAL